MSLYSRAELQIELAKLTLMIMRSPEASAIERDVDAAGRAVALFDLWSIDILQRTAAAHREYAERRIRELAETSPAFRVLHEASKLDTADLRLRHVVAGLDLSDAGVLATA